MTLSTQHQKHLVLLGAGNAHIHVLSTLASHALPDIKITLITPYPRQLYSGMVPGFVAGHYTLDDCVIPLEPLLKKTTVQWLPRRVTALNANQCTLTLDDGSEISYDWLSVNTGPVQERKRLEQTLPGVCEYGLFVRPLEGFGALWPRVTELAQNTALRVVVLGGGAAGIELAMAMAYRLPTATVTLVTGGAAVGANYTPAVQQRIVKALVRRNITVLVDTAVSIQKEEVLLASGTRQACDVPVIATSAQAPAWLEDTSLTLNEAGILSAALRLAVDEHGFIAVDACQRSTSHPNIFAAGDVSTRMDLPLARSGVYAVRAGPALTKNLTAVIAGQEPSPHMPPEKTLNLLSCANQTAIASWGNYSAQGRWVWWLKDWIDRSFIKRYRRT